MWGGMVAFGPLNPLAHHQCHVTGVSTVPKLLQLLEHQQHL